MINIFKNKTAQLFLSSLALVATVFLVEPVQPLASDNSNQTMTFTQSLNSSQSKTVNIPDLVRVENISTDNGIATYSINGNDLTVNVSGGSATGQQYNATKYSKSATKSLTSSSDSFASTTSFSDAEGYAGTLTKSGASTVVSGVFTPSASKTATDSQTNTSNSFPATVSYNSEGYSGTLSKNGSSTSSREATGGYWQDTGYYEDTGYWRDTGYWKTESRIYATPGFSWVCSMDCHLPLNQQQGSYEREVWVSTGQEWASTGSRWVDTGERYVTTYTTYYTQNYSGTVTKPASDTRVYGQNYAGTVFKSGYDNLYSYNVTIEVVTDIIPPAPATFSPNTTYPTNQNVTLGINFASDAVVKQYKVGDAGTWTLYTAPLTLSSNTVVYAQSADDAGNMSKPNSFNVSNIDKVAPIQPNVSSVENQNTISFSNIADSHSGVKETRYRLNGGAWNVYTTTLSLADGKYTVDVVVEDKAGNISATKTSSFDLYKSILANASTSVSSAEVSRTQEDVDSARALVAKMPTSTDKTQLTNRLDEVLRQMDAQKAVNVSVDSDTESDFKIAQEKVGLVTNEAIKTELQLLLDTQKTYLDRLTEAERLVTVSESGLTQTSVDEAREWAESLEDDDQTVFNKRLNDVQAVIDAKNAINKATETRDPSDVKLAQDKISLLDKTNPIIVVVMDEVTNDFETADILSLVSQERYDILSPRYSMTKEAYNSLVQSYYAIKYTGDSMYEMANEKFTLVSSTDSYFDLVKEQYEKLNVDYGEFVEERIESDAFLRANSTVKTLEITFSESLAKTAEEQIALVEDLVKKEDLLSRLDVARTKYETSLLVQAEKNATSAVVNAEKYKYATYVKLAQERVTALPTGEVKTSLQVRLDALASPVVDQDKAVVKAKSDLAYATKYKLAFYINRAQDSINLVTDDVVRAELQAELDLLK